MKILEETDIIDKSETELKKLMLAYQELAGNDIINEDKRTQAQEQVNLITQELKLREYKASTDEWDRLHFRHKTNVRKEGIPGMRHPIGDSSRGAF